MAKNVIVKYRWLAVLLVFPNLIAELFSLDIDLGSFSGNAKLIQKIVTYKPTAVNTLFDQTIHWQWIGYVGATMFILIHLVVMILLAVGLYKMIKYRKISSDDYHHAAFWSIAGLVAIVFYYFFFFAVIAMGYFFSMEQGINFSEQIVCFCLPAGIALLFVMTIL